jgi:hypothetical protein
MKRVRHARQTSATRAFGIAVVAFVAAGVLPAPASAVKDGTCAANRARGATVIDRTAHGVLFERRNAIYGCLYSGGHNVIIESTALLEEERSPSLFGRYVIFPAIVSEPTEPVNEEMVVYDLRLKRTEAEVGSGGDVLAFEGKANGSVAWIQGPATFEGGSALNFKVWKLEHVRRGSDKAVRLAATEGADDPASLAISNDRRRVYWLAPGGEPRSAPLN